MARPLIERFMSKLVPPQEFAGIEVGDKAVRSVLLSHYDGSVLNAVEVKLQPGVVEKGELKRQGEFIAALEALRVKIASRDKHAVPCIVTAPSSLFFFQIVELPELADVSYDEAVRLNASQNAPVPLQSAYLDWQNLGVNLKTLQREFLVGIAGRNRIDVYLDSFRRAGFEIIALESRSLSILRLFAHFSNTIEKNITALVIDIGQDGVSFIIGKQGKLYFDFFLYWAEVPEAADGTITREDLEAIVRREVLRMVEFANLHYQEGISHFVLFSPALKQELTQFIQQSFGLKPIAVTAPMVQGVPLDLWAGTVGAGLRGSLVPRETDDLISLLPEGTESVYQAKRLSSFISLWGKIVSFTVLGLAMVFAAVWGIALRQKDNYLRTLQSLNALPEVTQVKGLQAEARAFNEQLTRLAQVDAKMVRWSQYLGPLVATAAAHSVSLERVSLGEGNKDIRVRGIAASEQAAFDFSTALGSQSTVFSNVVLPLSSLAPAPGGYAFEMTLTLVPQMR